MLRLHNMLIYKIYREYFFPFGYTLSTLNNKTTHWYENLRTLI